mmetsp:Transcript_126127/g.251898  ORF Transcript_126127/g.251898 Transcript_126127/m.251898 type:complete len:262 (+) Transcript_126127:203-988(+)
MLQPESLEPEDLLDRNLVQVAASAGPQRHNDLSCRHRNKLLLFEEFRQDTSTEQLVLCCSIQVRSKLSKSCHLTILSEFQLQSSRHLFHSFDLGSTPDTTNRQANIHSRSDAFVEKLRLQENLSISNADHVCRNVCTHISGLSLDDGESRQRATSHVLLTHFGSTLQQARVEIEHISRVRLTPWRPTQQQRHLSVRHRLLGEIVIKDDRMHAIVSEVLCHGTASVRCKELEWGCIGCSSSHHCCELKAFILTQNLEELGHS